MAEMKLISPRKVTGPISGNNLNLIAMSDEMILFLENLIKVRWDFDY